MLRFNQKITLQTNTSEAFRGGCYTDSWSTAATFWANVKSVEGNETYENIKGQDLTKVKIITRLRTDIDKANCRLLYDDNIIHIEVVDKFYRGKYTLIKGRFEDG